MLSKGIVDDTGFLTQGKHSVGVQRQCTGWAGKVANCQIGVSLGVATRTEHLPLDFELSLPECWAHEAARRREARIPADVTFKIKPQLALQMIDRAVEDRIPPGVVLADTAYGSCSPFRAHLRSGGLHHAVAVAPAPPRPEGRLKPTRSRSRPERHFPDRFITARPAMARGIATWLPRCPTCYRSNPRRALRSPVHPSGLTQEC